MPIGHDFIKMKNERQGVIKGLHPFSIRLGITCVTILFGENPIAAILHVFLFVIETEGYICRFTYWILKG